MKIPLFELENLRNGIFLTRPNRFVSEIEYNNKIKLAHIHDPGRLEELLIKGTEVLFTDSKGKLDYYIKAVSTEDEWVLIDTSLHSKIALCILKLIPEFSKVKEIRQEVPIGNSRIDFVLDGTPLEVKGVTLVENETALFPDAPTKRGTRHVEEIIKYKGILLFLVFRKASLFLPNFKTDRQFSVKLSEAREKGIPIYVIQCSFDGKTIYYDSSIPLGDF